jgi:hypothetical protein
MVVRLSALRAGLARRKIPRTVSVKGLVDPRAIVRLEELCKLKKKSSDLVGNVQGGPDSIRQFLIVNNQSIQQHTGKWESTFCCR